MNRFYVGLNPRFQSFTWLPRQINVMLSAGSFWNGSGWRNSSRWPRQAGSKWLDSGGFTLLNRFGDYPFSVMQFLNFVCWLRPDFYASLDYPCEPNISRSLSLLTNEQRIRKTVENAARMAPWESYTGSCMVPVIQGYELEEYLACIELYRAAGLVRSYMAVGSMCRRLSTEQLHKLVPAIHQAAAAAGAENLHFFGLKLSRDLVDLAPFIYSRDSAVALDSYDPSLRAERGGRRWPKGPEEKRKAFMSFLSRVETLGLIYKTEAAYV
jgi:hypothetical protein